MWFFHLVETPDAGWECRRGRHILDRHEDADSALDHMHRIVREHAPAELFLHRLDGTITSAGVVIESAEDVQPLSDD
jgi:hypothetical protein